MYVHMYYFYNAFQAIPLIWQERGREAWKSFYYFFVKKEGKNRGREGERKRYMYM